MRLKHFFKRWRRITQKNASELHGKQLCFETQKLGKYAHNFFTTFQPENYQNMS